MTESEIRERGYELVTPPLPPGSLARHPPFWHKALEPEGETTREARICVDVLAGLTTADVEYVERGC